MKLKIANWAFKVVEIVELKIANGQNIAWIVELKDAKKHFWAENKELKITNQHDFSIETYFSTKMLVYKFANHRPHQWKD